LELRIKCGLQKSVFSLNYLVSHIIMNYKTYFIRTIWSKLEIFSPNFSVQIVVLFTSTLWFQINVVIFSITDVFLSLAQKWLGDYRRQNIRLHSKGFCLWIIMFFLYGCRWLLLNFGTVPSF